MAWIRPTADDEPHERPTWLAGHFLVLVTVWSLAVVAYLTPTATLMAVVGAGAAYVAGVYSSPVHQRLHPQQEEGA